MMRTARRVLAAMLCGGLLLASASARGDADEDRRRAWALTRSGDEKRKASDLKGALADYKEADRLAGLPTTALVVAKVQHDLGQFVEAHQTLERLIQLPEVPNTDEKKGKTYAEARATAEEMLADLTGRIPTIRIELQNVDPAMATQVSIDSIDVPPSVLSAPQRVNPGQHVVVAKVGAAELKQDVEVAERDNKTATFDFRDEAGATQIAPSTNGKSKALVIGGFSVALVGLGVGSVTGLMSLSKASDLEPKCPSGDCPRAYADELSSTKTLGNIATVAFIAGGVGLAAGIVGLVTSGGSSKKEPAPAAGARPNRRVSVFSPEQVQPLVGPSYVGIGGAF